MAKFTRKIAEQFKNQRYTDIKKLNRAVLTQKLRPAGFEPVTFGLGNRCSKNITNDKTETCETPKEQLTPQLTPKSQKQSKIDTPKLPDDLAEVVAVWPELPEHIKAAIKALVQAHNMENK